MDIASSTPATAPDTSVPSVATPPPVIVPMHGAFETTPRKKKNGSLGGSLAIIIVLVVLVVSALYVWGERVNTERTETPSAQ